MTIYHTLEAAVESIRDRKQSAYVIERFRNDFRVWPWNHPDAPAFGSSIRVMRVGVRDVDKTLEMLAWQEEQRKKAAKHEDDVSPTWELWRRIQKLGKPRVTSADLLPYEGSAGGNRRQNLMRKLDTLVRIGSLRSIKKPESNRLSYELTGKPCPDTKKEVYKASRARLNMLNNGKAFGYDSIILNALPEHGSVTFTELVRAAGMSRYSTEVIANRLLKEGSIDREKDGVRYWYFRKGAYRQTSLLPTR